MQTTKLTSARILVLFVVAGVILTGIGVYKPLVDFAGAGATVPLTGFGYTLAMGAINGVNQYGLLGALSGGVTNAAGGIAANIGQGAVGIVIAAVLTPLLSHAHEVRELMDKIRGAK